MKSGAKEDMLLQDWTGDLHKNIIGIHVAMWILIGLEALKFVIW